MSEGSVEEDNITLAVTSVLYAGMDVNKIRHSCDSEDVRQGDDNAAQLLADSSLVQSHAAFDPIFAPIQKLPPELLANIFIECIPSLELETQYINGMYPQQVRAWTSLSNVERYLER